MNGRTGWSLHVVEPTQPAVNSGRNLSIMSICRMQACTGWPAEGQYRWMTGRVDEGLGRHTQSGICQRYSRQNLGKNCVLLGVIVTRIETTCATSTGDVCSSLHCCRRFGKHINIVICKQCLCVVCLYVCVCACVRRSKDCSQYVRLSSVGATRMTKPHKLYSLIAKLSLRHYTPRDSNNRLLFTCD